ncbi:MAG: Na(+)-translocating NADH-quinone reductase subunit A [Alloprevotella sp.]|nr:Na(+)-translocating NADH-quinone reductase subunit A [Alloprevotella sp.]
MKVFKTKRGLNIPLSGIASEKITTASLPKLWALTEANWQGLQPKILVHEGDVVFVGTPLVTDKKNGIVVGTSAVSGVVKEIRRGERRKLLAVIIEPDGKREQVADLPTLSVNASPEATAKALCQTGLGLLFHRRPYDICIDGTRIPRDIFVSCFNLMPLAADFDFVIKGKEHDFETGIRILKNIAPVHLGIRPTQTNAEWISEEDADINIFDGPNPSGNVGVQIHHIAPTGKNDEVWTIDPAGVCLIGAYALTGKLNWERTIAVAGDKVTEPSYLRILAGSPISEILANIPLKETEDVRIIDGNPLTGTHTDVDAFTALRTTEVCAIAEGHNKHEVLGWILPRFKDFSVSRSYFSWLQKSKAKSLDCRIKGGKRQMIMSGEYDRVLPMDVLGEFLIKAIITGDIDKQEALGIYEVAPEDFAVAEFVDSSKLELQRVIREGLDILRKENE